MYAVVSPVISLIKKLISVITLIKLIKFRTNAYNWIAEDADNIAELVALPGIVPNRRNGRERCVMARLASRKSMVLGSIGSGAP